MAKMTIKVNREETSATLLPDGTLIRWFDLRLEDYTTLRTEVEVYPQYVESISFSVADRTIDATWEDRAEERKHWALSVSTRYSKGLLNLLKGAGVRASDYSLKHGSDNERDKGIQTAHVSIHNPKIGSINFHLTKLCSSDLEPFRDSEVFPTFEEIKAAGKYHQYPAIIVEPKVKAKVLSEAA